MGLPLSHKQKHKRANILDIGARAHATTQPTTMNALREWETKRANKNNVNALHRRHTDMYIEYEY